MPMPPEWYTDSTTGVRWDDMRAAAERNGLKSDRWRSGVSVVDSMITDDLSGEVYRYFGARSGDLPNRPRPHIYQIGQGPDAYRLSWTGFSDDLRVIHGDVIIPVSILPIMKAADSHRQAEAVGEVRRAIETIVFFPPKFASLAEWKIRTSRVGR